MHNFCLSVQYSNRVPHIVCLQQYGITIIHTKTTSIDDTFSIPTVLLPQICHIGPFYSYRVTISVAKQQTVSPFRAKIILFIYKIYLQYDIYICVYISCLDIALILLSPFFFFLFSTFFNLFVYIHLYICTVII